MPPSHTSQPLHHPAGRLPHPPLLTDPQPTPLRGFPCLRRRKGFSSPEPPGPLSFLEQQPTLPASLPEAIPSLPGGPEFLRTPLKRQLPGVRVLPLPAGEGGPGKVCWADARTRPAWAARQPSAMPGPAGHGDAQATRHPPDLGAWRRCGRRTSSPPDGPREGSGAGPRRRGRGWACSPLGTAQGRGLEGAWWDDPLWPRWGGFVPLGGELPGERPHSALVLVGLGSQEALQAAGEGQE